MPNPPKRLRIIVQIAEAARWTYDETEQGHPRLNPPSDLLDASSGRPVRPVTFSKTPSDVRGDANAIGYLRRNGVDIPHKNHKPKGKR